MFNAARFHCQFCKILRRIWKTLSSAHMHSLDTGVSSSSQHVLKAEDGMSRHMLPENYSEFTLITYPLEVAHAVLFVCLWIVC
ncbi:hypothetical protein M5K25_028112 [Dendrobium thyrsiflorum]|uniref:Uncharacterized protein n=1 Tax=Dendrobium thyrsiflorum TaxID=117978 RepID=A0ABD0TVU7_DENTH